MAYKLVACGSGDAVDTEGEVGVLQHGEMPHVEYLGEELINREIFDLLLKLSDAAARIAELCREDDGLFRFRSVG